MSNVHGKELVLTIVVGTNSLGEIWSSQQVRTLILNTLVVATGWKCLLVK